MHGNEILLEAIKANGVDRLFMGGGSTLAPVNDALIDHPEISPYLSLHESCAVAMADGFSRATRHPAVALVHVTPGSVNALGAMHAALSDKSPLIVIAGQRDTRIIGHGSLNEAPFDLPEVARQFSKASWQVLRADRIMESVSKAFKIALSPPMGPVFLSLPKDFLKSELPPLEYEPKRFRVQNSIAAPRPVIAEAAELLTHARFPVIFVGAGVGFVVLPGAAEQRRRQLAVVGCVEPAHGL